MRISLVFEDWRGADHKSIYSTEKGVELSLGSFHSGTTFDADILLPPDEARNLADALAGGYRPVFYVVP